MSYTVTYFTPTPGVDTTDVEKDSRPGFMQHFDKKDENKKKIGKKADPNGPHDISYYFPDIPEGMDFRDFVSALEVMPPMTIDIMIGVVILINALYSPYSMCTSLPKWLFIQLKL